MKNNAKRTLLYFLVVFIITAGTMVFMGYYPGKASVMGTILGIIVISIRILFLGIVVPLYNKMRDTAGW